MKKKSSQSAKKAPEADRSTVWVVLTAVLIVAALFVLPVTVEKLLAGREDGAAPVGDSQDTSAPSDSFHMEVKSIAGDDLALPLALGSSVEVRDIVAVEGTFPEDGSDERRENTLGIVIENKADRTLEYLTVVLTLGENTYNFTVSTLPPASSVIVYEAAGQSAPASVTEASARAEHTVFFAEEPTCREDTLSIQMSGGNIIVTNISGEDIGQDFMVYYKSKIRDYYVGGITYCARVSGGLRAGESRTLYAPHAFSDRTRIMFVNDVT